MNYEYRYLMEYLPKRYSATMKQENDREVIYDFKNGYCSLSLMNTIGRMHQGNKKRNRWLQLESLLHTSIHPPQDSLPLPKARNLHREGNRNCLRLPYHPANPGPGIRPHHRQEDKPGRELQHQDKRRCRQEHHPHR